MITSTTNMTMEDDVMLAKQGNIEAYTRLAQSASNVIHSIALSITKDVDAAKDVLQQVLIKIWQDINQLNESKSFLPWVRQVTRYSSLNYLRDNKVKNRVSSEDADSILQSIVCDKDTAELSLLKHEQNALVLHLLDNLSDESREIVVLYYAENQNSKSVAGLLGLTETTVRKRLQRVRSQIKDELLTTYGRVILSTLPTSISSIVVMASMGHTSKVAAAVSATTLTKSSTSLLSKFAALLSGMGIAAFFAIIVNALSMRWVMSNVKETDKKEKLADLRKKSTVAIGVASIVMWFGYEFTNGWLVPVFGFVILSLALALTTKQVREITKEYHQAKSAARQRMETIGCYLGLLGGCIGGGSGLLIGLNQAGRLAQVW